MKSLDGHPLHPQAIAILTKLGWWMGKLQGLYWLSFCVGVVNITRNYLLRRRVRSAVLGFVSGIMYVLFFADTTQAYLTYSFGLQPSITLLLLAGYAYLNGNRWLPYLLSILILLTYETVFPLISALALSDGELDRDRFKKLLRHIGISVIILLVVISWRTQVGENRIGQLTLSEIIRVPLLHSLQGPPVSFGTYFYRPLQTIQRFDSHSLLRVLSFTTVFFVTLNVLDPTFPRIQASKDRQINIKPSPIRPVINRIKASLIGLNQVSKSLIRMALTGSHMLILAYPLTFTIRDYSISERDTRVHAAGVVGAAILAGSLLLLAIAGTKRLRRGRPVIIGIALWLGALASFG